MVNINYRNIVSINVFCEEAKSGGIKESNLLPSAEIKRYLNLDIEITCYLADGIQVDRSVYVDGFFATHLDPAHWN